MVEVFWDGGGGVCDHGGKNVIMGMMVIIICFYQDQGEDGGELHDGVW